MFGRLFSKSKPSFDSVTFDSSRYRLGKETDECRTWFTPEGDGLGLYLFNQEPDLPRRAESARELREYYVSRYATLELRVVEVDLVSVDGVRSVWTLFKVPQKPHGLTYLASVTIPFSAFSFVLKMQCQERGITGIRETTLIAKGRQDGRITIGKDGIIGDWNPDDPAHDAHFPQHPVSRARREFGLLRPTIAIDPGIRKQKHFFEAA